MEAEEEKKSSSKTIKNIESIVAVRARDGE